VLFPALVAFVIGVFSSVSLGVGNQPSPETLDRAIKTYEQLLAQPDEKLMHSLPQYLIGITHPAVLRLESASILRRDAYAFDVLLGLARTPGTESLTTLRSLVALPNEGLEPPPVWPGLENFLVDLLIPPQRISEIYYLLLRRPDLKGAGRVRLIEHGINSPNLRLQAVALEELASISPLAHRELFDQALRLTGKGPRLAVLEAIGIRDQLNPLEGRLDAIVKAKAEDDYRSLLVATFHAHQFGIPKADELFDYYFRRLLQVDTSRENSWLALRYALRREAPEKSRKEAKQALLEQFIRSAPADTKFQSRQRPDKDEYGNFLPRVLLGVNSEEGAEIIDEALRSTNQYVNRAALLSLQSSTNFSSAAYERLFSLAMSRPFDVRSGADYHGYMVPLVDAMRERLNPSLVPAYRRFLATMPPELRVDMTTSLLFNSAVTPSVEWAQTALADKDARVRLAGLLWSATHPQPDTLMVMRTALDARDGYEQLLAATAILLYAKSWMATPVDTEKAWAFLESQVTRKQTEGNKTLRRGSQFVLQGLNSPEAVRLVKRMLNGDEEAKQSAVQALAHFRNEADVDVDGLLGAEMGTASPTVRVLAARAVFMRQQALFFEPADLLTQLVARILRDERH
jgi:HEAT repeat protein